MSLPRVIFLLVLIKVQVRGQDLTTTLQDTGKSYSSYNYNKYYYPAQNTLQSTPQKVYNGQPIAREASQSYSAPETGVGGGGGDLSSSYGTPSQEYGAGGSGGYSGGGGGGQMFHYQIVPAAAAPAAAYGVASGGYDDDDDDDDDEDGGGGLLGGAGGGATQALCIAKLIGLKGKKIKLIKKIKKLKKILKIIKFAPFLFPLFLPLLLIPLALLLLIPIPVITPFAGGRSADPGLNAIEGTSRGFDGGSGGVGAKISEFVVKAIVEREECVERITCELSQGADEILGKRIGSSLRNKFQDYAQRSLKDYSVVKRISRAGKIGSCAKFACKPVNAIQNYIF